MQPKKLRILMVMDQFWPIIGGAEHQAERIGEKLVQAGHKVSMLTRQSKAELPLEEEYKGIKIHRLPFRGSSARSKLFSTLPAAMWLIKHRNEYDLIHCHGNNPLEWGVMLSRLITRKPYVVKLTNPNFLNYAGAANGYKMKAQDTGFISNRIVKPMMLPALRFTRTQMIKRANRIYAISPEISRHLKNRGYKNIVDIPNGIDTENFSPSSSEEKKVLREELGLAQDSVIFVFTGRLSFEKNLLILLKAWHNLTNKEKNKKIELLLLGDSNGQNYSAEQELRHYVKDNNLLTLTFKGAVNNVRDYLRAADVFILPSIWEGMSNALLESMACGLPAIVSDIPANRHLVEDKQSGLLFPVKSHEYLENCMQDLIDKPHWRIGMGRRAREIAVNNYSLPVIADHIMNEYGRILSGSNGNY